MKNTLLKFSLLLLSCGLFAVFGLKNKSVEANAGGPPTVRSGAPGEQTCAISGCHTGTAVNGGTGTLTISGLPATYSPSQDVDVTVTMAQASRIRYGFEATMVDDQGRKTGDLVLTESARTQLSSGVVGSNVRQYIMHTSGGTSVNGGTNQGRWTFRWHAPAQSVGRVTLYVAANAANNNGDDSGDQIYTKSASMQPAAAVTSVATVSAASFAQNSSLAAETIVAGFGAGLSQNVVVASTVPLPTQLDGTQVIVRDATNTDRTASLFFVAPTQVNYLIPASTAIGAATVSIQRSGVTVAQGTVQIEAVAPGMFSAAASGQGVAAAVALRVSGAKQTYEPISASSNGQISAVPIDLGPETDQVYLILYGTGFRGNSGLSSVNVTIGGTNIPVLFAGASPDFVGLDQCNIGPIARSLLGRGDANVVFAANGKAANTVTVNIK